MTKRITLYLYEDEYDFISSLCKSEKISMNRYFQDFIREQMKYPRGFTELKDTNTWVTQKEGFKIHKELKPIKTNEEAKRVVEKFPGLCKHGFMKGLCKHGCS